MPFTIEKRYEKRRGCGYRQKGGLYFVSGAGSRPCGKLPIELTVCPCCGQGIQFSRGFTWVGAALIREATCKIGGCQSKGGCFPFNSSLIKRFGLMWVGEKFYKTPEYFNQEAALQGISKRLPFVPKDFTVGTDWVLLAHSKTPIYSEEHGMELKPGIFRAFCPERIEYVVTGNESEADLQAKADQGITLVDVYREEENPVHVQLNLSDN
ncbi:hypothetical protein IC229_05620 [Spirosoma sp. BT702]|uniref:Uncharacterized protein n=1 Tax=Spirosoma profusum TaxID=2771354 RepID=A0A926XTL9_9BACT|nr:hypothetical protein [Spirosoma profusum]MBD2700103.1 hypothetical protein [Spirosoma profusum]